MSACEEGREHDECGSADAPHSTSSACAGARWRRRGRAADWRLRTPAPAVLLSPFVRQIRASGVTGDTAVLPWSSAPHRRPTRPGAPSGCDVEPTCGSPCGIRTCAQHRRGIGGCGRSQVRRWRSSVVARRQPPSQTAPAHRRRGSQPAAHYGQPPAAGARSPPGRPSWSPPTAGRRCAAGCSRPARSPGQR